MATFMHPLVSVRRTGPRQYSTGLSGASGCSGTPTLRLGSVSPCVPYLRTLLANSGYARLSSLPSDVNAFDGADHGNVVSFQSAAKTLSVDGIVGPATWARLVTPVYGPATPPGMQPPVTSTPPAYTPPTYSGPPGVSLPATPPAVVAPKTLADKLKDPKVILLGLGGLMVVGGLAWSMWPQAKA